MGKETDVKDFSKEQSTGKRSIASLLSQKKVRVAMIALGILLIVGGLYYWRANPSGPPIEERLKKSQSYYRRGEDEAAKKILLEVINSDEASDEQIKQAKLQLANVYDNAGDKSNAIKLKEEIVDEKTHYSSLMSLAELYEEQGNKTKAKDYYQKAAIALAKEPEFPAKLIYTQVIKDKIKALGGS